MGRTRCRRKIGGAPGLGKNPTQQAAVQQAQERVGLFGEIVRLLLQSPPHKHRFLSDLEWLVLPPGGDRGQLGQVRPWRNAGMPPKSSCGAFASWAYLDERAEARLKDNVKKLGPSDWKSSEALWLIDLIAPFGGGDEALKELKAQVFQGKTVKSLQPAPGNGMAVAEW